MTAFSFYGPTCDSMDYMKGPFILPNNIKEGDYISLANVGAYGLSLSSNYNTRPFIAEIMVSGSKHKIIRKRQSLKNLVNN